MATEDPELPLSAVHEYKIISCPGFWLCEALAALVISDVNAQLTPRLISTSVEALRLAILPIEYGTRVSISDESDPRAYVRLTALLRREISDGTLAPGMPTPSITTLSQQYGHARQTCAKALRILEDEGLLVRIPGLGYYVKGTPAAGSAQPGA
jgi:Bacterial regulatory proteins, gntR family